MKKVFISLMLAASVSTATYAGNNVKNNADGNTTITEALQELKQKIASAPSGTTYGVAGHQNGNIVVNTPLGKYTIERNNDGSYSFMGMKAKLLSAKNGVYTVDTSLGTWMVNTRKCTVTKK